MLAPGATNVKPPPNSHPPEGKSRPKAAFVGVAKFGPAQKLLVGFHDARVLGGLRVTDRAHRHQKAELNPLLLY
jgi:hypothetical protein